MRNSLLAWMLIVVPLVLLVSTSAHAAGYCIPVNDYMRWTTTCDPQVLALYCDDQSLFALVTVKGARVRLQDLIRTDNNQVCEGGRIYINDKTYRVVSIRTGQVAL